MLKNNSSNNYRCIIHFRSSDFIVCIRIRFRISISFKIEIRISVNKSRTSSQIETSHLWRIIVYRNRMIRFSLQTNVQCKQNCYHTYNIWNIRRFSLAKSQAILFVSKFKQGSISVNIVSSWKLEVIFLCYYA